MVGRIVYHCTAQHAYTLERWFDVIGKSADGLPEVVIETYDRLGADAAIVPGTHVFTDEDRLTANEMQAAVRLARRVGHAGPGHAVANWPNAVRNRCELLTLLHRRGRNTFRCFRLETVPDDLRFPVFLRVDHRHKGPETPLLHDARELEIGVRKLLIDHGVRRQDVLVVEFLDTDRFEGNFAKYAAYCAFGEVRPANMTVATGWTIKARFRVRNEAVYAAEFAYVRGNPHAAELAEIFALAQIDYGRIDYALKDGRVEVFEINTNPHLLSRPNWNDLPRRERFLLPWSVPTMAAVFRRLAEASDVTVDAALAPAWGTRVHEVLWGAARHNMHAERGRIESQLALATMYALGEGASRDPVQAWRWYDIAATRLEGPARDGAMAARERAAAAMSPQQIEEARRLVAAWWAARGGIAARSDRDAHMAAAPAS